MSKTTTIYGCLSHAGGRTLEVTSEHAEWTEWAVKTLNDAGCDSPLRAELEAVKAQLAIVTKQRDDLETARRAELDSSSLRGTALKVARKLLDELEGRVS